MSTLSQLFDELHRKKKSYPLCVVYGLPRQKKNPLDDSQKNLDSHIEQAMDTLDKQLQDKKKSIPFCSIDEFKSTQISTALFQALGETDAIRDKQVTCLELGC